MEVFSDLEMLLGRKLYEDTERPTFEYWEILHSDQIEHYYKKARELINFVSDFEDALKPKIIKPMSELPYDETVEVIFDNGTVCSLFWYDQTLEEFISGHTFEHRGPPVGWFRSGDLK